MLFIGIAEHNGTSKVYVFDKEKREHISPLHYK